MTLTPFDLSKPHQLAAMVDPMPLVSSRRWGKLLLVGALLVGGSGMLLGCAGVPMSGGGNASVPLTESDEPATRKRARIRTTLAGGYLEKGQDTVALDEIKQALLADPSYTPAYVLRGLIYMRLSEYPLAEQSFLSALRLDPKDPDAMHNYAWFLCEQKREKESIPFFARALTVPAYAGQAKTLMAKGTCEIRAGLFDDAEISFTRSYRLDPNNPFTGYNLASLMFKRGAYERAQFYIRRLNNTDLANAESLWLGIKTEKRMNNAVVANQLFQQLQKRFPDSPELGAYRRGAFHE